MAEEPEKSPETEPKEPKEEPAAGKKKGLSKLVLIGLPVVLLAGGAVAAWYLGFLPFGGKPAAQDETAAEAPAEEQAASEHAASGKEGSGHGAAGRTAPGVGAVIALEPFIANLADEGGGRYLKATFQVEFLDKSVPDSVEARMPQIRDLILTLITSKTFDEIRTAEGKQELREAIINRINQRLDRDAVKAVYFTEFIVQ
jgi:flagellar FliL protein